jgi:hypothetical protein
MCGAVETHHALAIEPDRHAGLELWLIALRVKTQVHHAAIVIADGALGLPGRERSERRQFGDDRRRRFIRARPCDVNFRAYRETLQRIFASVERQPLFAGFLDH